MPQGVQVMKPYWFLVASICVMSESSSVPHGMVAKEPAAHGKHCAALRSGWYMPLLQP